MSKTIYSQSRLKCYLTCQRKYLFSYIDDIQPRKKNEPLVFGTIIHSMLEEYYKKGTLNFSIYSLKDMFVEEGLGQRGMTCGIKASALLESYIKKYKIGEYRRYNVEKTFLMIINFRNRKLHLKGILDLSNDIEIVDHKVMGQLNDVTTSKYYNNYQICYYFLLHPAAQKFTMNFIKRPGQFLGKKEGIDDFNKRVHKLVSSRKNEFFKRITFYREEFEPEELLKQIYTVIEEIEIKTRIMETHPNEVEWFPQVGYCKGCDYWEICASDGRVNRKKFSVGGK